MSEPSPEILRLIAKELTLEEELLGKVEDMLLDGNIEGARYYLLGLLDGALGMKEISEERAKQHYEWLDFPPEEMSRLRQKRASNPVPPKSN